MGKGGKRLQNASQEIKELQEYNHELQDQIDMKDKLIKTLEMKLIHNQNIIDHMVDTMQSITDLRDEIEMKNQLIDALQIKLSEKQNQIDDMIDATSEETLKVDASCDTEDLIEKFDASCDTEDLIEKIDAICATEELIQMVDAECDTNEFIQKVDAFCDTQDLIQLVDIKETEDMESFKDEFQKEAQNNSSDNNKCEEIKEYSQNHLSKKFVRPWEELHFNRNHHGLGYENQNSFHIPNYSKPILFVSAGFLQEKSILNVANQNDKCQHCNRVGHMEDQCFDLHPCQNCGKSNHASDKCSKRNKPARLKIHYEWIDPWQWSLTAKQLYKSYRRIQSRVKTCFEENSEICI
jgi:hypothetical protein